MLGDEAVTRSAEGDNVVRVRDAPPSSATEKLMPVCRDAVAAYKDRAARLPADNLVQELPAYGVLLDSLLREGVNAGALHQIRPAMRSRRSWWYSRDASLHRGHRQDQLM